MTEKNPSFDDLDPIRDEPQAEPELDDLQPVDDVQPSGSDAAARREATDREAAKAVPAKPVPARTPATPPRPPAPATRVPDPSTPPKAAPEPASPAPRSSRPAPKPEAAPQPNPASSPGPIPVAGSGPSPPPTPAAGVSGSAAESSAGAMPDAEAEPGSAPAGVRPSATRARRGGRAEGEEKEKGAKKAKKVPPQKPGTESRDLEQAPKLLRIAALILLFGCLTPWMRTEVLELAPGMSFVAKGLVLLGAYVFHQGLRQAYGDTAPGFARKLDIKVIPPGGKSFGWSVVEILGLLVLVTGLLPIVDAAAFPTVSPETGNERGFMLRALQSAYGDKGMLALACLTLSHIYAYSKGAHFNPLVPLIFTAPAFAGFISIMKTGVGWWTVGALASSAAGLLAVYTIVVALRQAKSEGDAKRAAQLEARRVARKRS